MLDTVELAVISVFFVVVFVGFKGPMCEGHLVARKQTANKWVPVYLSYIAFCPCRHLEKK